MEQVWSFAGMNGGGGIFDVDSHEELDAIMGGFPFSQHSYISIYALADIDSALSDAVERVEDMMATMGVPA